MGGIDVAGTFVVYIDESGDEGFRFGAGSTDWFALSAVITRKATDHSVLDLVDRVRSVLGKPPKKPLHFRDLKHEQKLPFLSAIAQAKLRTVTVLVHKPSLREPEKFQERYRLYFYAVRYLLERVSWYCRDHKTSHDAGDGGAKLVFSSRSGMSYGELKKYLEYLKERTGPLDVRIEWSVVDPKRLVAYSPGRRAGLQIADAACGAFFYAVQPTQYGFTEDRYARMLEPVVYRSKGQWRGYGLKFWPGEAESLVEGLPWVREAYR